MPDHTCTAEEAYDLPALGVTWVVVCATCGELQGSRSYDLSDARGIGRQHKAGHDRYDAHRQCPYCLGDRYDPRGCPTCGDTGFEGLGPSGPITCSTCGGGGVACPVCEGLGEVPEAQLFDRVARITPERRTVADLVTALEESLARAAPTKEPF